MPFGNGVLATQYDLFVQGGILFSFLFNLCQQDWIIPTVSQFPLKVFPANYPPGHQLKNWKAELRANQINEIRNHLCL
jgi:hypothetical protein